MRHLTQHRKTLQIYVIATIAAMGGLLFGFDTGVISGAIPFLQKDFHIDDGIIEMITTSGLTGAMTGALLGGKITDCLGRKKIIFASAVIFTAGAIWSGGASNWTSLVLARFFLGIAIGISSFAVPLYIAEISPADIRGKLVSLFQLMITLGVLVSYLSDLFFADETETTCWRSMFYAGAIPAVILLTGILAVPESPRWLISRGYRTQALNILQRMEKKERLESVMHEIDQEIAGSKEQISQWGELLKPPFKTSLFIAIGIMFFQQFVGINTVIYYSPKIFFMAGFEGAVSAIWAAVGVGIVNLVATFTSLYLIDRIGRRKLYLMGLSGIALFLLLLSVSFIYVNELGKAGRWFTVIFMLLYVACYAISIGPLGWLLVSEVFPQKIRGIGTSVGSFSVWVFNSIVTFTFFKIVNGLTIPGTEIIIDGEQTGNPAGAFGFYGLIAIVAIIWGYFHVPETKGVSLEKINNLWKK